MATWFETKLRYERIQENGTIKRVTEPYLVDALSFTEAEARITEEMAPLISGGFTVSAVKRDNICEVIDDGAGDRWYRVRAMFISVNEKTGADKKAPHDFIVRAYGLEDAISNFKSNVTLLVDYELYRVEETPIMDVYPMIYSNDK